MLKEAFPFLEWKISFPTMEKEKKTMKSYSLFVASISKISD